MKLVIFSIAILVLSFLCMQQKFKSTIKDLWNGSNCLLIIGIMSAPNGFETRQAVRLTWKTLIQNNKMKYYFLIGQNICEIHPEDRIDKYSCDEWTIRLPKGVDETYEFSNNNIDCQEENFQPPMPLGFTFITHHRVVIRKLSILRPLVGELKQVKVSLVNHLNGERITSATFSTKEGESIANSSQLMSKSVEAYVLPKGFEGEVRIELKELPTLNIGCRFSVTNSGSAIRFLHQVRSVHEKPCLVEEHFFTPVVMTYTLQDIGELKSHIETKSDRQRLWKQQTEILKKNLEKESQERKDILFLDVVDVYRNLPDKILHFFQWIDKNQRFSYLLKTDDDTFIDIPLVEKELMKVENSRSQSSLESKHIWWWSSFREYWPVQTAGKWREDRYNAMLYPPFPCGAGYVLSYDAVRFLATNADLLYRGFQGEDVSVGIWLSVLNPISYRGTNDTCIWSCSKVDNLNGCNRAELSIVDMLEVWDKYQEW